jgi:short-subunit dehydrogenase
MKNQVVVVIGASGGLGSEIARAFSKAEERVVLAARDMEKLTSLANELNASTYAVDITDFASVEALRNEVMQNYGRVDVVVNAAGYDVRKAFEQHTAEDLRRTLDVNLLGAMNITHAFVGDMADGVIAHLGGFADGRLVFPYYAADAASRAGVASFVEAMNRELRLEGKPVTLLYFSPSPADTDAERPFHELWRQMGTKIVSTEQVAAELRRAVIQKRRQYVMGGALVNGFAKLNAAFPDLADLLMMNQYGKKLQSFFGKAAGTETRSSLALKTGLAMVIFSVALYGVIFSLPFFPISTANKLALTPVLMGISEIIFWVGGALAGKDVVSRYRSYLDPREWCKPKEKVS